LATKNRLFAFIRIIRGFASAHAAPGFAAR